MRYHGLGIVVRSIVEPIRLTADNRTHAARMALVRARDALARGLHPVIAVENAQMKLLVEREGANLRADFGITVNTWQNLIKDWWELFGDGRRLVEDDLRRVLCLHLLGECDGIQASPAYADMLARLVRDWDDEVSRAAGEGERGFDEDSPAVYRKIIDLMRRYREELDTRGLVEPADAAYAMLTCGAFRKMAFFRIPGPREPESRVRFFAAAADAEIPVTVIENGCRYSSDESSVPSEIATLLQALPFEEKAAGPVVGRQGAVELALPAGPVAEPGLIAELIVREVAGERVRAARGDKTALPVYVVAPDPEGLFRRIGGVLSAAGIQCSLESRTPWVELPLGAAFTNLLKLVGYDAVKSAWAVDFAMSPCSGVDRASALAFDLWLRGSRGLSADDVLRELSGMSDTAAQAVSSLREGDAVAAVDALLEQALSSGVGSEAEASAHYAAASAALRVAELSREFGLSDELFAQMLGRVAVRSSGGYGNDVVIGKLSRIATMPPNSASTVIIIGLTADNYAVAHRERPEDVFLESLGLLGETDNLHTARTDLFNVLDCACNHLILERCLRAVDAEDTYSCVLLEDMMDCYLADPTDAEQRDKQGLPKVFTQPGGRFASPQQPGEDAAAEDLPLTSAIPGKRLLVLQDAKIPRLSTPGSSKAVDAALLVGESTIFSASQIESYLTCPYRWFVQSRLKVEAPDASFGPLEKGTFAHEVLRRFYERLSGMGVPRVTAENLDRCREVLTEVFDEEFKRQREIVGEQSFEDFKKQGSPGALVAASVLEEQELENLKANLSDSLVTQARVYPTFVPTYLEYAFGGSDEPVMYAGVQIRGSIDRIDVDMYGHAVIWDYKGSVKDTFDAARTVPVLPGILADAAATALAFKEWEEENERRSASGEELLHEPEPMAPELPLRVQALIYAQIARRVLGVTPVAAMYLSYGKAEGRVRPIAGAFAKGYAPPEDLLMADEACRPSSAAEFCDMLDEVERRIAIVLTHLREGNIPASPRIPVNAKHMPITSATPCRFCTATTCEVYGTVSHGSY